jgi:hypothetical protein
MQFGLCLHLCIHVSSDAKVKYAFAHETPLLVVRVVYSYLLILFLLDLCHESCLVSVGNVNYVLRIFGHGPGIHCTLLAFVSLDSVLVYCLFFNCICSDFV